MTVKTHAIANIGRRDPETYTSMAMIDLFPNAKRGFERIGARPAVRRGMAALSP